MIRITGIDRNRVLDNFNRVRAVASKNGSKEVTHDYTHTFNCKPAAVYDDMIEIKTYHEENDVKILERSAKIMSQEIKVELV